MTQNPDVLDDLDLRLTRVARALTPEPNLERVERRVASLARESTIQIAAGLVFLAVFLVLAFAFGWRVGSLPFLVAIVELSLGLVGHGCIRERRLGQVSDDSFLSAVRHDRALDWLGRGGLVVAAGITGAVHGISVLLGPVEPLDLAQAFSLFSIVAYEAWAIRRASKSATQSERETA